MITFVIPFLYLILLGNIFYHF